MKQTIQKSETTQVQELKEQGFTTLEAVQHLKDTEYETRMQDPEYVNSLEDGQ